MTARRTIAGLLALLALGLVVVAVLTPLRASEIAELDAEARRLGEQWIDDQGNEELAEESNEYFRAARALEPPLPPLVALGGALLFAAAATVTWPTVTAPARAERADAV